MPFIYIYIHSHVEERRRLVIFIFAFELLLGGLGGLIGPPRMVVVNVVVVAAQVVGGPLLSCLLVFLAIQVVGKTIMLYF